MARQNINIGSSANDGTGDPLRTAFDKINDNFVELYGTDNDINTLDANLDVNTFAITTGVTNGDITVTPNGTGSIKLGAMKFNGTTLSSDDSTIININEGLVVDGTANISGATTLATSLTLATGATVTGIDNGALGSSATLLATQGAIKTYVDAQVTAQDLDFACDDSTTLSIDLDSESLQFSGGTGITTAGTGNTVTVAIDGTVTTLTGSQTLTNKVLTSPTINAATMTGTVTVDSISMADNTITTNASNADLELDASGTGQIRIIPNATVVGTLSTANVITTGDTTISGSLTTGTFNIGDLNIDASGKITTDTNGDVNIDPSGTGAVVINSNITHTGTQTTTGEVNVDNLNINGNTITATNTNGGVTITPDGNGTVTLNGNFVAVPNELSAEKIAVANTLFMGANAKISAEVTGQDIVLETNGTGSVVVDQVSITDNKITTHVSNADLQIDTDGTGAIQLLTNTNVSGSLTATSLTTNEITSNGSNADINIDPSGTGLVAISNLKVDGNIQINDNKIATTVSNSNLQLGANGSGKVELMSNTISRTGDIIFDVTDDLIFDAGGKDIIFRYNGVQFGLFTASGTDLLIQSGTTTALTFSGANAAFSGDVSVAGAFTGSRQAISGPGAINLTTLFTEITTTGADAFSLANGTVGQVKIITMAVHGGDATITPTTFANGTSMTMDAVHDSVTLIYGANGWVVLASQNVTINA